MSTNWTSKPSPNNTRSSSSNSAVMLRHLVPPPQQQGCHQQGSHHHQQHQQRQQRQQQEQEEGGPRPKRAVWQQQLLMQLMQQQLAQRTPFAGQWQHLWVAALMPGEASHQLQQGSLKLGLLAPQQQHSTAPSQHPSSQAAAVLDAL
jgi:hypothetical protein